MNLNNKFYEIWLIYEICLITFGYGWMTTFNAFHYFIFSN